MIRNAKSKNETGTIIDVEINHPQYGWIPYTFNTNTVDNSYDDEIREYLETNTSQPFTQIEYVLDELKVQKINEAKSLREQTIIAPLNNVDVDSLEDRENIQGSIDYFDMLSQGQGYITWVMADNTLANLTLADLQAVLDGFVARKAQAFAEYIARKTQVEATTTIEELEAIKW